MVFLFESLSRGVKKILKEVEKKLGIEKKSKKQKVDYTESNNRGEPPQVHVRSISP